MLDLKGRRLELGLTLLEVAKAVGVSEATISRYESGNIKNMRRDRIEKYAQVLNVNPSLFIELNNETQPEAVITESQISDVYLSFAKDAQDQGIDPQDIKAAIDFLNHMRGNRG